MGLTNQHINELAWIDEFIDNVRPYIFVRTEDNILIKRPNQATRINQSGARILKFLTDGGKIEKLIGIVGIDKASEIQHFLLAIKNYLEGNIDEFTTNPAVDKNEFALHFSKLPVLSELALTYSCNLKCKFCYAGCNCTSNPAGSEDELSLIDLKSIIRTIFNEARVPSISFTGGEPTLRVDILLECIKYAKKLGMRVNLITNGTLIDKRLAGKLKYAGLDSAQVSLEGVTPEIHDHLVQATGAFHKCVNAVRYLSDVGIHVHTNTTLNKFNGNECLLLPGFVKNTLGLSRFSMNLVIPTGSSAINHDLVVSYSEVGRYIKEIIENSRQNQVEFMWYSPVPMCIFNTITNELGNRGCAACDGLLSVAPNGDVLPCASYDKPVGNLLKQPFIHVWEGTEAQQFKNKNFAHEICLTCDSFAVCNGGCPLYWRKMGYNELISVKHQQIAI